MKAAFLSNPGFSSVLYRLLCKAISNIIHIFPNSLLSPLQPIPPPPVAPSSRLYSHSHRPFHTGALAPPISSANRPSPTDSPPSAACLLAQSRAAYDLPALLSATPCSKHPSAAQKFRAR